MKITVICGSSRENGTSMLLADRFIEGMTAQIKRVIDRFYAFNEIIRQQHKLAICASEDIDASVIKNALQAHCTIFKMD